MAVPGPWWNAAPLANRRGRSFARLRGTSSTPRYPKLATALFMIICVAGGALQIASGLGAFAGA